MSNENDTDDPIREPLRETIEPPEEEFILGRGSTDLDIEPGIAPPSRFQQTRQQSDDPATTDLSACDCEAPTLAIATDTVGPTFVQVLFCESCEHRFKTVSKPATEDSDD